MGQEEEDEEGEGRKDWRKEGTGEKFEDALLLALRMEEWDESESVGGL